MIAYTCTFFLLKMERNVVSLFVFLSIQSALIGYFYLRTRVLCCPYYTFCIRLCQENPVFTFYQKCFLDFVDSDSTSHAKTTATISNKNSAQAQKKHRPRGSMSAKTVLSVRDQGLEPWTPWLRVRCSTNWANRAYLIVACFVSLFSFPSQARLIIA